MDNFSEMSTEELVDLGWKTKAKLDSMESYFNAIKAEVRNRAKKAKADHLLGEKHFSKISPATSTECKPLDCYDAYVDVGRETDFFNNIKVLVGKAKADLGEALFSTISEVTSTPYKNVTFKEKVPKKYQE